MHRTLLVLTLILALIVGPTLAPAARAGEPPSGREGEPLRAQQPYCPRAVLIFGGIIIRADRCYALLVLRDTRGLFLAFADANAKIPPGQLVRLRTPAGAKLKGRIFYLVPIRTSAVLIPMDSIAPVSGRVQRAGTQLTIVITNLGPGASVVFQVRS